MKHTLLPLGMGIVFLAGALLAFAELDTKANPTGVKVKLVAKTTTYRLSKELAGFKAPVGKVDRFGGSYPAAPEVDMVLEIVNDTDREMHIRAIGGDDTRLVLDLQGDGALSATVQDTFTQERRPGKTAVVAAHKTYEVPIKSLRYGYRNLSDAAYWTKPGAYTLAAGFHTQVGWKDDKDDAIRMRSVTLASEPIQIKVEADK